MIKIIVMTDIHITKKGNKIIGLDPMRRFQEVYGAAIADHPDAALIILMGDLTHHGKIIQYQRLSDALHNAPIPVLPMLGNHDIRENFREVFLGAPTDDAGFVQKIIDLPDHCLITLDTKDGPFGHHVREPLSCTDGLAQGRSGRRKRPHSPCFHAPSALQNGHHRDG